QVIMDGSAMSKSRGNLVVPGKVTDTYGADTLRGTMLFASAPEDDIDWADVSPTGMHKWLARVWRLSVGEMERAAADGAVLSEHQATDLRRATAGAIVGASQDFDARKYNTAIA